MRGAAQPSERHQGTAPRSWAAALLVWRQLPHRETHAHARARARAPTIAGTDPATANPRPPKSTTPTVCVAVFPQQPEVGPQVCRHHARPQLGRHDACRKDGAARRGGELRAFGVWSSRRRVLELRGRTPRGAHSAGTAECGIKSPRGAGRARLPTHEAAAGAEVEAALAAQPARPALGPLGEDDGGVPHPGAARAVSGFGFWL